jgi:hypothetical protein
MELHVVKDVHGSKHDSYPFLLDSNEQDKALIHNLMVSGPFLQKKGKQTTAWTNNIEMTFETMMPNLTKSSPKKLAPMLPSSQPRNVSLTTLILSRSKYCAMMPSFNSGGDNEPFSDNLCALEDLYELHKSFKNATTQK